MFGSVVATARFAEPASELVIAADILIEQAAPEWPVFRVAPGAHSYPFSYSDDEAADLSALLRPIHADEDGALARWAYEFVLGPPTDTLSLLKDINAGIMAAQACRAAKVVAGPRAALARHRKRSSDYLRGRKGFSPTALPAG